jgi:YVTN family beta-propeller protein
MFAYVTIGGLNEIKVFRTDNFAQVATIPTGKLPHGIWPSGDGTRVYVGLENEDKVAAIDTLKNEVIATSPVGQAPQALVYVPDAIPAVSGALNSAMTNLQPLGIAGQSAQLWLAPPGAKKEAKAPTSVSLSDQGLVQVLEAAVTGLEPGKPYLLALASEESASLIGRLGSSAFRLSTTTVATSLAGSCFSSESAHGPFHHGIRGRGGTIFRATLPGGRSKRTRELTSSIVPRGTPFHRVVELEFPPVVMVLHDSHATAASLVQRNSVPSAQMRCMITASRRASATIALFMPRRLAICIAQALSHDHFAERNSMAWAAS